MTEVLVFNHSGGGSAEWVQVADASHDIVNIRYNAAGFDVSINDGSAGTAFTIGDITTTSGDGAFLCIENPNADVWVRLRQSGHSCRVMRGTAKLTPFIT